MAQALTIDFWDRVVAVIASGLLHRQAAIRFSVSAASAVRSDAACAMPLLLPRKRPV